MTRSNEVVAETLREFAELLSIAGEDQFRVRAYEKAARAVAEHPVAVDGLDEKALDDIPAVGSHIAAKIRELLSTGRIGDLDDLRARVPAGLRVLLDVPGLGPKRARQVYEELGITSLPELLDALHAERLRTLRGWGPASEENLRGAIGQAQQAGARMQIGVALDVAEGLVEGLRQCPAVELVTYAGSLRRMCETIGDVDLLVASSRPAAVMDAFARSPLVANVSARGSTKCTATTTKGVHVDLRVVAPRCGVPLFCTSPAPKPTISTCGRSAEHLGLKLSEYGARAHRHVFDRGGRHRGGDLRAPRHVLDSTDAARGPRGDRGCPPRTTSPGSWKRGTSVATYTPTPT